MFFSFDGIDGVGKSTQIQLFADWLDQQKHTAIVCRDPGSTELGEQLREILLHKADTPIGRRGEMLMYMAARAQLVDQVVRPAIQAGQTIVSDRFLLANVVYQGHGGGLNVDDLWDVGRVAIDGVEPDLTFLLDMPVEVSARRMTGKPDRMESQGVDFMEKVRQGFLAEARRLGTDKICVIDADREIEVIQSEIRDIAAARLAANLGANER